MNVNGKACVVVTKNMLEHVYTLMQAGRASGVFVREVIACTCYPLSEICSGPFSYDVGANIVSGFSRDGTVLCQIKIDASAMFENDVLWLKRGEEDWKSFDFGSTVLLVEEELL
ncbi:MAG: hypothetical protein WAV09_00220 [Minisyncoccia bacterium]